MNEQALAMGYPKNMQGQPVPLVITGWISWFLSLEDHEFYLEIDREFIIDKMN
jgi:hypothetical protein